MDPHLAETGGLPPVSKRLAVEHNSAPPKIPDHQLLRCIGRGSYGSVWLARNQMGIYRAIKIVYRRSFESHRPFEREWSGIQKFEPISRSHEGFVDVLHVGLNELEGYFYYVMELGDDQVSEQNIETERYTPRTLAREISRHGRLPMPACLQLGIALSQALGELHQRNLVHRDVKPSNIIFVNGVPKLADIGLVAEAKAALSYVGTEGFIPPEGPGTAPADVYGLGKVLYEASTGKDRQDFPELPTQLDELPDHAAFLELNEVILRACKSDVTARYQSAWDMHADLLVVANGKSVKRLRALERGLANLKRGVGATVIILALAGVTAYHFYQERKRQLDQRQQQVGATLAFGIRALASSDYSGALLNFAKAIELELGTPERETMNRLRFGSTAWQCPRVVQMWFATNHVEGADIRHDGQQFVIADYVSGQARVYDFSQREPLSTPLPHARFLHSAQFSPDGAWIVTAAEDNQACVWRASDGRREAVLPHPHRLWNARFSPDGSRIITAGVDGNACIWDWRAQTLVRKLQFHKDSIMFAGFSPDGSKIVTTGKDDHAVLWDALTGQRIGQPLLHGNWVRYAAFSPDGRTLVTAAQDNKAYIWDVSSTPVRRVLPDLRHGDKLSNVAFSPDGRLLVTSCLDGTVCVWLLNSHQLLKPVGILRHPRRVTHALFHPDGHRLLTCCADGTIRLWDLANEALPPVTNDRHSQDGQLALGLASNGWGMRQTADDQVVSPPLHFPGRWIQTNLSPNGHFLAGVSVLHTNADDKAITAHFQIWDTLRGQPIGSGLTVSNTSPVADLANDGSWLVTCHGQVARKWDLHKGTRLWESGRHLHPIVAARISPQGERLALWGGKVVTLWDMKTGQPCSSALTHEFTVSHVSFSGDGRKLAICESGDMYAPGRASVYAMEKGRRLFQLDHGDGVVFASFSPDEKWIATAGEDFKAMVWNAHSGAQVSVLRHEDQVRTAVFSPDSRWVLTASWDGTARLWSVESGHPLTPPLRHLRALGSARFLQSETILTVDYFGTARVWKLPIDRRPLDDLFRLTEVLSGEAVKAAVSSSPQPLWEDLRTRYAGDFSVTPLQVEFWHEFQGTESFRDQQWEAARFHFRRVLQTRGPDRLIDSRLATIEERLNSGN